MERMAKKFKNINIAVITHDIGHGREGCIVKDVSGRPTIEVDIEAYWQELAASRRTSQRAAWYAVHLADFCQSKAWLKMFHLREFTTPVYPDQGRARAGGSPVM